MKRIFIAAGILMLSWAGLRAQSTGFLVAPSMLYKSDTGLVPIWIQNQSSFRQVKFEIYDVFGNLVWDSTANDFYGDTAKWYGTTNGGRRVQSGQYMLIIKALDEGFENIKQREWIGVVW